MGGGVGCYGTNKQQNLPPGMELGVGGEGRQGGVCAAPSRSQALNPCLPKEFAKEAECSRCLDWITTIFLVAMILAWDAGQESNQQKQTMGGEAGEVGAGAGRGGTGPATPAQVAETCLLTGTSP